ncbi:MAG: hypothetical protein IJ987_04195 [Firmicutes bacterium]|nr:hypothetical protein [Bacillota bacterium]
MNKLIYEVRQDLSLMRKVKQRCERLLPELPEGSLNIKTSHGCTQYFHIVRVPGQPSRQIYISKHNQHLISQLKQKVFLKKMDTVLNKNIRASEKFLSAYQPWDHDDLLPLLPQKHGIAEPPKYTPYRPEGLRFETAAGCKVRSKSEVIIADALYFSELTFDHEKPTAFGLLPDFTITLSDGSTVIWEHFGLINDPVYRLRMFEKLSIYQANGFYPGRNLILSFDGPDGTISSKEIFRLIEIYLLPCK